MRERHLFSYDPLVTYSKWRLNLWMGKNLSDPRILRLQHRMYPQLKWQSSSIKTIDSITGTLKIGNKPPFLFFLTLTSTWCLPGTSLLQQRLHVFWKQYARSDFSQRPLAATCRLVGPGVYSTTKMCTKHSFVLNTKRRTQIEQRFRSYPETELELSRQRPMEWCHGGEQ